MLLAALVLRQHAADLVSVSPRLLPTDGSTPSLHLTGDGVGGLLAGSAWSGRPSLPSNQGSYGGGGRGSLDPRRPPPSTPEVPGPPV